MISAEHEVVIVGAGFSGLGTAIKLAEAGFDDVVLLEEGDRVGGTWNWNTYPGVAVDIPSFSYQFSFEQDQNWSRVYAPGHELLAYAEHLADKYRLLEKVRFRTRLTDAEFDETRHRWTLSTEDGQTLTARWLISATGVLTQPKRPDIPGVEDFAGATMHTARWDHSEPLAGRRVGIIGTGASAVQIIPAIAGEVAELIVFQRTPIWCLPKPDAPLPAALRGTVGRLPGAQRLARAASQAFVEVTFPLAAHYHALFPLSSVIERAARGYIASQVTDPETREQLTPRYSLGCKRPSFHNQYLATFNQDHVHLVTDPIDRVLPSGVRTRDGSERDLDLLILATGFKVFEHGNMPTYRVTGRRGVDLEGWWEENRFQAYEGVSVPGFPNLFSILGPYGYNGSSYFALIETQVRHIVRCLKRAREDDATLIEVRAEANSRYFAEMLRRRRHQVFWQEGCAGSNSYYFDAHGDVPLKPVTTLEAAWRSARFDLNDYRYEKLRPAVVAA